MLTVFVATLELMEGFGWPPGPHRQVVLLPAPAAFMEFRRFAATVFTESPPVPDSARTLQPDPGVLKLALSTKLYVREPTDTVAPEAEGTGMEPRFTVTFITLLLSAMLEADVLVTVTTAAEADAVALEFADVPVPKQGLPVPQRLLLAIIAAEIFCAYCALVKLLGMSMQ